MDGTLLCTLAWTVQSAAIWSSCRSGGRISCRPVPAGMQTRIKHLWTDSNSTVHSPPHDRDVMQKQAADVQNIHRYELILYRRGKKQKMFALTYLSVRSPWLRVRVFLPNSTSLHSASCYTGALFYKQVRSPQSHCESVLLWPAPSRPSVLWPHAW